MEELYSLSTSIELNECPSFEACSDDDCGNYYECSGFDPDCECDGYDEDCADTGWEH